LAVGKNGVKSVNFAASKSLVLVAAAAAKGVAPQQGKRSVQSVERREKAECVAVATTEFVPGKMAACSCHSEGHCCRRAANRKPPRATYERGLRCRQRQAFCRDVMSCEC
jgi:hypothetical protein